MKRLRSVAAALLAITVLVGCSSQPPASKAPAAPASPTAAQPASPAAPAAQKAAPAAPAKAATPQKVDKIVIAQSALTLAMAPTYVAIAGGFFAKEGIEAELQQVQGDATVIAAIQGGSAHFGVGSTAAPVSAIDKGGPFIMIHGVANKMSMDVVLNKAWAQGKGVAPGASVEDVVKKALKGSSLATASLGGAPDRYSRWLMQKYGFDKEKDISIVRIGGLPEILTAIKQAAVNGVMWSPPAGQQSEQDGFGFIAIPSNSVPEFKIHTYEVMYVNKGFLEKNSDLATRTTRAMANASDMLANKPAETVPLLKKYFNMPDELIVKSLKSLEGAFGNRGLMSEDTWKNAGMVMFESGAIEKPMDIKEGKFWTNAYNK